VPVAALLALSNSAKEVVLIGFIVLVPTVPVAFFAWNFIGSHRNRGSTGEEREIEAGRSPATPFAMISIVGSVIAVAAITVLLLAVAVRAVAA
jgi:hypothetical protein